MTDASRPAPSGKAAAAAAAAHGGDKAPADRPPRPQPRTKGPPKEESKIRIPYPSDGPDAGVEIVGILSRNKDSAGQDSRSQASTANGSAIGAPRPLALILHGLFAHKNQTYHRSLAASMDIDTFRFDFRGNHESSGKWCLGDLEADFRDLCLVVDHMRKEHNYRIEIIIAHSRGAGLGWEYYCKKSNETSPEEQRIPYYVSVCARWYMPGILELPRYKNIGSEGHHWTVKMAGQTITRYVEPDSPMRVAQHPVQDYAKRFPTTSEVLIIHGTRDDVVPTSAASGFTNAVAERGVRFRLHLVDGADHNLRGHYPETVDAICDWLQERRAAHASALKPAPTAALESSWQSSVGSHGPLEAGASSKSRL